MKRYRLYCFDFDDTLVETFAHASRVVYPALAGRFGLPAPGADQIAAEWGRPLSVSLARLFPGAPERRLQEALRSLYAEHPIPPAPGAARTLSILRRHGRLIALYSAGDPRLVAATVRASLGLEPDWFDCFYLLAERGERKSAPEALARILSEVGRRAGSRPAPADTLVLGDDPRDGLLARNGGADFHGVTSGPRSQADFLAAGFPTECLYPGLSEALKPPLDHGVVAVIPDGRERFLLVQEGRRNSPYHGAWSGPHGRCIPGDVVEEETVYREVLEECGVPVRVVRPLYTRPADTKVRTVTFWEARLADPELPPRLASPAEVLDLGWFGLDEIRSGRLPLYPGTRDFFDNRVAELLTRTRSHVENG